MKRRKNIKRRGNSNAELAKWSDHNRNQTEISNKWNSSVHMTVRPDCNHCSLMSTAELVTLILSNVHPSDKYLEFSVHTDCDNMAVVARRAVCLLKLEIARCVLPKSVESPNSESSRKI
ncbi:hypothetical protein CDAR_544301 [Caerostris darwini]|uniref:Uncharacterized protein n=1 Tax=Caerostris darwini TaxID=1538125 RepID=A0AAV4R986_9ARAC|nr:hypothetical protein CDAR_544301 [Caerostris darwini]